MLSEELKEEIKKDTRITTLKDLLSLNAIETFCIIVDSYAGEKPSLDYYKEIQEYVFEISFGSSLNRFK